MRHESPISIYTSDIAFVNTDEWFSVDDRLPEPGQGVLLCDSLGYMNVGSYVENKHFHTIYEFHVNGEYEPDVKWWRPLPDPPKGVEE